MKKIISTLFALSLTASVSAQTLSPTYSIIDPGAADTLKGSYTFAYPSAGTPFAGSLISYGGFQNQYDTQISTNYQGNNMAFRTRNGDINAWNSWKEVYHSGNINNATTDFSAQNMIVNGTLNVKGSVSFNSNTNHTHLMLGMQASDAIITDNSPEKHYGGGYFFRVAKSDNSYANALLISDTGNIGIGKVPQYPLDVYGSAAITGNMKVTEKLEAKEIKVTSTPTADFVFEDNYNLPKLEDIEKHIKEKKHLPEIASAAEMRTNGLDLGEFQIKLLQKIEELTLHQIDLNKRIIKLERENELLKK